MDYYDFATKITKLYTNHDENYSAQNIMSEISGYRENFVMYVLNEENISIIKVEWLNDVQKFFDRINLLKGKCSRFANLKYLEMQKDIPYFAVEFH